MSAYDTIIRDDDVWVRVYCESPMAEHFAVQLTVGPGRSGVPGHSGSASTVFVSAERAVEIATALLDAAARARHAAKIDRLVSEVTK